MKVHKKFWHGVWNQGVLFDIPIRFGFDLCEWGLMGFKISRNLLSEILNERLNENLPVWNLILILWERTNERLRALRSHPFSSLNQVLWVLVLSIFRTISSVIRPHYLWNMNHACAVIRPHYLWSMNHACAAGSRLLINRKHSEIPFKLVLYRCIIVFKG